MIDRSRRAFRRSYSPDRRRKARSPTTVARPIERHHVRGLEVAPPGNLADGTLVVEFKRTMLIPKRGHSIEDKISAAAPSG